MRISDWCAYDMYYASRTPDGLWRDACLNCNLQDACRCQLHCQYDTFSDLIKLPTKEEVNIEMERRLDYYRATYPLGTPSLKGKYFWSMECEGRGRELGFSVNGVLKADEEVM